MFQCFYSLTSRKNQLSDDNKKHRKNIYFTAFSYFHKSSNDDTRLNWAEFVFLSRWTFPESASHIGERAFKHARSFYTHFILLGHLSHVKKLCRCATTEGWGWETSKVLSVMQAQNSCEPFSTFSAPLLALKLDWLCVKKGSERFSTHTTSDLSWRFVSIGRRKFLHENF